MSHADEAVEALDAANLNLDPVERAYVVSSAQVFATLALADAIKFQAFVQFLGSGQVPITDVDDFRMRITEELRE